MLITCWFFFFQAEDGIRDDLVTGVQTCALPICFFGRDPELAATETRAAIVPSHLTRTRRANVRGPRVVLADCRIGRASTRSEERRVGKEWRSWWSRNYGEETEKCCNETCGE